MRFEAFLASGFLKSGLFWEWMPIACMSILDLVLEWLSGVSLRGLIVSPSVVPSIKCKSPAGSILIPSLFSFFNPTTRFLTFLRLAFSAFLFSRSCF